MKLIAHRLNHVVDLENLPKGSGVEIDVRANGKDLILNHEPFQQGDLLKDFLAVVSKDTLVVFNIKEAGIEAQVHELAQQNGIENYFLLDVEFPYIYRASREGERRIAMRYSEDESFQTVENYRGKCDWVWIDTNTKLPLDPATVKCLVGFKTCLVCPERWGRPQDILPYRKKMQELNFKPDAVMTSLKHFKDWSIGV